MNRSRANPGALGRVANAYGEASELQLEAIARLRRRLTMPDPSFGSAVERPLK